MSITKERSSQFKYLVKRTVQICVSLSLSMLLFLAGGEKAFAIGSAKSNPQEGVTQMKDIEQKSRSVTNSQPMGLKQTQSTAAKGINEVQGRANLDKMNNPDNSQDATSIQDEVKDLLGKALGE